MKKQLAGFLGFVREQGVVGLAVGLAIGTAAGASVKEIVEGIISPIIGFIIGGTDLSHLEWNTGLVHGGKNLILAWGAVANSIIVLLATAAVIYFIIHGLKLDKLDKSK